MSSVMPNAASCALAAVLLLGCVGRASPAVDTPASAGVRQYIAALQSDDPRDAYAMLAAEVRAELSYDEFARAWADTGVEREAQARELEEALRGEPEIPASAAIELADGKTIHLVHEDRRWRLVSAIVSRSHAARPHDAVESFAAALADRSVDDLLAVLTTRRRDGVRRQLDAFVDSLQAHLASADHEIYLVGDDRAELEWGSNGVSYKLVLRREEGEWRVDDVHLLPRIEGEASGDGDDSASDAAGDAQD